MPRAKPPAVNKRKRLQPTAAAPAAAASGNEPSARTLATIRAALLARYDAHARDLPWRRTSDPYAIWVSEIMLQQTQVATVLRYYDRFLAAFPDLPSLAAADEDAVLAAWSGLGYYRRARMLHAGVREVVARYGGVVPEAAEARRTLPGIGRYTAGAIGSIAFDRQEPLVDGNVARVFARLFGLDTPISRADTQAQLWSLAERLVAGPRPGALNQSLMELGATVCSKAAPSCDGCPVITHCIARRDGRVRELPVVTKKAPPARRQLVALLAEDPRGEHLLLTRSDSGLFAGLWNLPMADGNDRKAAKALLAELGATAEQAPRLIARLEHVLTHRHLEVQLFGVRVTHVEPRAGVLRLQPRHALDKVGVSALTRKALELAVELPIIAAAEQT
ncbi:MAG: A/G-specific adenine glycosylase [Polyangiales bacterium]